MRRGLAAAVAAVGCLVPVCGAAADPAAAPRLPDRLPFAAPLRGYLATLEPRDFVVDLAAPGVRRDYARLDGDTAYRDWLAWAAVPLPDTSCLRARPECFTLAFLEATPDLRCFGTPESAAWWVQFEAPGHPYFGQRGARMRAAMMSIVDMILIAETHERNPATRRSDFLGASLLSWVYTFLHVRPILPPEAVDAYRAGLLHHFALLERWGPTDINSNMDTRVLPAVVLLAECLADPEIERRAVAVARRTLFGRPDGTPDTADGRKGIFHPAGYVGEMDGPETSYNGIAGFYILDAALRSRGRKAWDAFLPEVVRRMARLKACNAFPDPDGFYEGPSSWAKRTSDSLVFDQRARLWRDPAAAMLCDDALYLLTSTRQRSNPFPGGFFDRAWLAADIARATAGQVAVIARRPLADDPPPWKSDHWPEDIPYTWDAYVPGSHARLVALAKAGDERLLPPFARPHDFDANFARDFWIAKHDDWGFQVESLASMGRGYENGGLAGGSVAEFWTKRTGTVIRGKSRHRNAKVKDEFDVMENWATHHVWGRTAAGKPFSSARIRAATVTVAADASPAAVEVRARIGRPDNPLCDPEAALAGPVAYTRRFEKLADGLRIATTIDPGANRDLVALWETLPVNLGNALFQKDVRPTGIAFSVDGRWAILEDPRLDPRNPHGRVRPGETVERVAAILLRRFDGAVLIELDRPRRVRSHAEPWQTPMQTHDRVQVLAIDLLGDRAGAAGVGITYTLKPRR